MPTIKHSLKLFFIAALTTFLIACGGSSSSSSNGSSNSSTSGVIANDNARQAAGFLIDHTIIQALDMPATSDDLPGYAADMLDLVLASEDPFYDTYSEFMSASEDINESLDCSLAYGTSSTGTIQVESKASQWFTIRFNCEDNPLSSIKDSLKGTIKYERITLAGFPSAERIKFDLVDTYKAGEPSDADYYYEKYTNKLNITFAINSANKKRHLQVDNYYGEALEIDGIDETTYVWGNVPFAQYSVQEDSNNSDLLTMSFKGTIGTTDDDNDNGLEGTYSISSSTPFKFNDNASSLIAPKGQLILKGKNDTLKLDFNHQYEDRIDVLLNNKSVLETLFSSDDELFDWLDFIK